MKTFLRIIFLTVLATFFMLATVGVWLIGLIDLLQLDGWQ